MILEKKTDQMSPYYPHIRKRIVHEKRSYPEMSIKSFHTVKLKNLFKKFSGDHIGKVG